MVISGNLVGKVTKCEVVLSSQEQKKSYYLIKRKLHRAWISNKSKLFSWFETHFLALKLKSQKVVVLNIKIIKSLKRSSGMNQNIMQRTVRQMRKKEDVSDLLVTHQNNILQQIFLLLRCTSTPSNFTIQMDCRDTSLTIPTNSRVPSLS